MKGRWFVGGALMAAMLVLALYFSFATANRGQPAQSLAVKESPTASDRPRSFSLTDSSGTIVTDRSFKGDWLIVFFGFTNCPDTCPAALFKLSKALEALGGGGARVRVAFITIDPERDSPQALKTYLKAFGPRFTGLTGSQEQIRAAEQTFRAYGEKQARAPDGNYGMNHSSSFYVLDPKGQFQRQVSSETSIPDLTASIRNAMNSDSG